jgi:hypothetical protein
MEIGAKVLPTRDGNLRQGLDVASWLQEGLLDFVVPTIYLDRQTDPNFPFEWLVELSRGTDCEVYPTLQRVVRGLDLSDGRYKPSSLDLYAGLDHLRAGAASYWDRGADGIYMLFLKWPHGEAERTALTQVQDPDLLKRKPKHYVHRRHRDESAKLGYESTLLAHIEEGGSHSLKIYVADDVSNIEATLRLRMIWSTTLDEVTVSVNGVAISLESAVRNELDAYVAAWLEIPVPDGVLVHGWNEVSLALNARPATLDLPIAWESAELVILHPTPLASSPIP